MTAATGPVGAGGGGLLRVPVGSQTFPGAVPGDGITITPPARRVRIGTAGSLLVTYATGQVDTIDAAAGENVDCEIVAIGAASTAQNVTVFW